MYAGQRETMLGEKREEVFRVYLGTLMDKYKKAGAIRTKAKPAVPGMGGSLPLGT